MKILPRSRGYGRGSVTRARLLAACLPAFGLAALTGCNTAPVLPPPLELRAASAAPYAVDIEFDVPLLRRSAEDVTRYTLTPAAGGAAAVVASATLVDTLNGRVVQLVVPDWLTTDPDGTDWRITTQGVLSVWGKSTGTRELVFQAGLSYATPMRALFDARCSSCHGATRQEGSYRTDSYSGLLGNGTDGTADLIANDPACLLVRKCKPHNSMFILGNLTYFDFELLRNWVTSYNARP